MEKWVEKQKIISMLFIYLNTLNVISFYPNGNKSQPKTPSQKLYNTGEKNVKKLVLKEY